METFDDLKYGDKFTTCDFDDDIFIKIPVVFEAMVTIRNGEEIPFPSDNECNAVSIKTGMLEHFDWNVEVVINEN